MRTFHAIVPDHLFIFHVRNDEKNPKGSIAGEVTLIGSRAATVAVIVFNHKIVYGIARCQWAYQFNRKLAREVATGRAKKAYAGMSKKIEWYNEGTLPNHDLGEDPKEIYKACRGNAIDLIKRVSLRAIQNGYAGPVDSPNLTLDRIPDHE